MACKNTPGPVRTERLAPAVCRDLRPGAIEQGNRGGVDFVAVWLTHWRSLPQANEWTSEAVDPCAIRMGFVRHPADLDRKVQPPTRPAAQYPDQAISVPIQSRKAAIPGRRVPASGQTSQ
jgi:hypothetical protein